MLLMTPIAFVGVGAFCGSVLPRAKREEDDLMVLWCTLLGCISARGGQRREAVGGVFIADDSAKPACVILVSGRTGDDIKASMLATGPLIGDSPRSRREDSLDDGVARAWDCRKSRCQRIAEYWGFQVVNCVSTYRRSVAFYAGRAPSWSRHHARVCLCLTTLERFCYVGWHDISYRE